MLIERAIFTSARTQRFQGYHLVSRSSGIDQSHAAELTKWCPSHDSLASTDSEATALNFFPLGRDQLALSRTFFGGPEYSGRGGRQVITLVNVVRKELLEQFEFNPLGYVRIALSMGWLHWTQPVEAALSPLEFHGTLLTEWDAVAQFDAADINPILRMVRTERRVAVIGLQDPSALLSQIVDAIPARQRLELSFTTGLKPSPQRPFLLQFYPAVTPGLRHALANQNILFHPMKARELETSAR